MCGIEAASSARTTARAASPNPFSDCKYPARFTPKGKLAACRFEADAPAAPVDHIGGVRRRRPDDLDPGFLQMLPQPVEEPQEPQELFDALKKFGVNIHYLGGETADLGDVVRTITVNGTMTCRWPKNRIISNEKIKAGDVIIGLAGFGQASYEIQYNSGIGSNGLTCARHDVLSKFYAENFKESYDNNLDNGVVYIGDHRLSDTIEPQTTNHKPQTSIGQLLLSPTRTFAPVMKILLADHFDAIHGLIHCSGGGQTKCMKYLPGDFRVIKDNLFEPPEIFRIIQQSSGSSNKEMYEVFNMGCRMEIYCDAADAAIMIAAAERFGIAAQVIGRVEESGKKELVIRLKDEEILY